MKSQVEPGAGPTIVVVSPDALSVVLFCGEIIRQFQRIPGARVVVASQVGAFRAGLEALGVEIRDIPMYRHFNIRKDVAYTRDLYRLFRDERPAIVLNMTTKPLMYGTFAATAARVPWIINYNVGLGQAFQQVPDIRRRAIGLALAMLYWVSFRLCHQSWFTNATDLEMLVQKGLVPRGNAVVTNFYLDTDYYSPGAISADEVTAFRRSLGIDGTRTLVAMVARLIWPKGIREFVESAEEMAHTHPQAFFVLVAPQEQGSESEVPMSYIEAATALPNFKWIPFMNDPRLVYAAADMAVLPSFYPEGGFPRTLTEPMAMGKPLITTDNASCKNTVDAGRNGLIVPMRDSKALADAISTLVEDPDRCRRFGSESVLKARREFNERVIVPEAFEQLGMHRFGWPGLPARG